MRCLKSCQISAKVFQKLTHWTTEVIYQVGEFYTPGYEKGLRYDDPAFNINWPLPVREISDKDANWSFFNKN